MKKVQRNFAVEYKSGRRRVDAKPNSIWGNLDLKSVARDVEESAMPLMPESAIDNQIDRAVSPPKADDTPSLTPPVAAPLKSVPETQEMYMADDTDTMTTVDAPAVVEPPIAPKKQRKPRSKKPLPATVAAETAVGLDGVGGQKKRGRKPQVTKGAAVAKRSSAKGAPKGEQTATVAATSAGDEMADLLQLEEENKRLRKLLAEKLRAENADLRQKLKLG